jgi:class 3 adenylate cyclase
MPDSALQVLLWAEDHYQAACDSNIFIGMMLNFTSVYLSLGDAARIDSIAKLALSVWNPSWHDHKSRFAILTNQAIGKVNAGDTIGSTIAFHALLEEAIEMKSTEDIMSTLVNLGTIKGLTNDLDSAYYFYNVASQMSLTSEDSIVYMDLQYNLAMLDFDRGRPGEALIRFDSLYALAAKRNYLEVLTRIQSQRAKHYESLGAFKRANYYLNDFIKLREEFLDEERIKSITEMQEKYETEKKARQIQDLKVANLDATLKNERITNTRNRYLFAGSGVFLLAIGLWTRLQYMRKSRAAVQHEKNISDSLLLNILPASVADELKIKGHSDAKLFPHSTILFTDFKSFTEIASDMSPTDLVSEINVCFKAFDEIITTHGLEKIKTIGDAYMAAASIPETNTSTAIDAVRAALDMQRFCGKRKKERDALDLPSFSMRAGIHSGPVVAGIVGLRKFQYDLWGDTVNTASRMESNGEVGRINISESTYQLVRDQPGFTFTYRGLIDAKGKGSLAMYFVDPVS